MAKYIALILILIVALILSFAGIRGTMSRRPPIMLFDDLDDQPRYKAQSEGNFFPDGRAMRPTPAGAIPAGRPSWSPVPGESAMATLPDDLAAFELKTSPLKIEASLLSRGQQVYSTFCTVCHGGAGAGTGIVTQYNAATPATYHSDRLRDATDGYLYKVITEGKGLMGGYGASIRPADRWAAVAYVRALQRSQNARIEDVPQVQREELQRMK